MSDHILSYFQAQISHCQLCPRMCGVDRNAQRGFCQAPAGAVAARAALHFWEEPLHQRHKGKRYRVFQRLHSALLLLPEL